MRKHISLALSLLISFVFVCIIWQLAEAKLVTLFGKALYTVTHKSFIEVDTVDAQGIPLRYYPGVGTVYEPELIAREASRMYDTRIEPDRQKRFEELSNWLIKHLDGSGLIPQQYDIRAAQLVQPWFNASTQTAAMVAIAKRAGQTRDIATLDKAKRILNMLEPEKGKLSRIEADSTLWFVSYPKDSLNGMLSCLLDLQEYAALVKDSLAADMLTRGVNALQLKLPEFEHKGYLQDPSLRLGIKAEHVWLSTQLAELNAKLPGFPFNAAIIRYRNAGNAFILFQLVNHAGFGRISGFLGVWALLFLIVYAFLRTPKRNLTI